MKISFKLFGLLIALAVLISACGSPTKSETSLTTEGKTVEYSLMSTMVDGQMTFVGVGGGIEASITQP